MIEAGGGKNEQRKEDKVDQKLKKKKNRERILISPVFPMNLKNKAAPKKNSWIG